MKIQYKYFSKYIQIINNGGVLITDYEFVLCYRNAP